MVLRTGLSERFSYVGVFTFVVCLALSVLTPDPVQAQKFGRTEDVESSIAYYYYALPGQATVQVSLWGSLGRTGIYEIPDSTGLDRLLSMAGGAPIEIRQKGKDPARVTVQLHRNTTSTVDPDSTDRRGGDSNGLAKGRRVIFSATMEEMLSGDVQYPILQEDDIIVVEVVRPRDFDWRDVLRVVTSLGTLALLTLRLSDRVRN